MRNTHSTLAVEDAASTFAALGSEQRLTVLNTLVRAGPEGLPIGTLGERTGVTGSTLTHHVRILTQAGLVHRVKRGRSVICAAVAIRGCRRCPPICCRSAAPTAHTRTREPPMNSTQGHSVALETMNTDALDSSAGHGIRTSTQGHSAAPETMKAGAPGSSAGHGFPVVVLPEVPAESDCCGSAPTPVSSAEPATRPGMRLRRLWQRARQGVADDRADPAAAGAGGSRTGAPRPALCRRRDPAHRHVHRRCGAGGGLVAGDRRRGAPEPVVHGTRVAHDPAGRAGGRAGAVLFLRGDPVHLRPAGGRGAVVGGDGVLACLAADGSGDVPDHRGHAGHRVRGGEDGGGGGARAWEAACW